MSKINVLNTLDRYLFGQLAQNILFAVILFSIIWLAPETLFKLTQYVFGGNISLDQAATMFMYHLPGVLQQSIPVAVLLGCLFVFQRLSSQFELIAMFAAGVRPQRMMQAVILAGVVFAGLHFAVQEYVTPVTGPLLENYYQDLNLKEMKDRNFVFVEKNHQGQLEKFFMISQAQKDHLSDFVILYYEPDSLGNGVRISRILRAKSGRWAQQTRQWELKDGIEYVLDEEGVYKDIRLFDEQQVRTSPYASKLLDYSKSNPKDMGWNNLRKYINLLEEGGQLQDLAFFQVRLWQKFMAPFAGVCFAVIGALLGIERVRAHRTYGLLFGTILVFIYSVLSPFSNNIANFSILPVWLVAAVPLLVTVLAAWGILKLRDHL